MVGTETDSEATTGVTSALPYKSAHMVPRLRLAHAANPNIGHRDWTSVLAPDSRRLKRARSLGALARIKPARINHGVGASRSRPTKRVSNRRHHRPGEKVGHGSRPCGLRTVRRRL